MWNVLTTAYNNWSRHRSARLGAALAYYSVFSLGPLLLIVISHRRPMFGQDAVRGSLTGQFRELLGPDGGASRRGDAERRVLRRSRAELLPSSASCFC